MFPNRRVTQREQYERESQKGTISSFSQLEGGHFCSCPGITAATARVKNVSCLAGSSDRYGVMRACFHPDTGRIYCVYKPFHCFTSYLRSLTELRTSH